MAASPRQRRPSLPPRPPRTTIREITNSDDPALRRVYALLTRSFHHKERVTLREWRDSLREKASELPLDTAWHLLVAERAEQVVGLASGTYLGNVNLGVIGYLAMVPSLRSLGIGTRLRSRLRAVFARDAIRQGQPGLKGIIGEVNANNPWLERLSLRPAVLVLDFIYYQPRLHVEHKPSPYVLYYESMQAPRARIPVGELQRILYTVWRRVYRVSRPLERPAFRAMLHELKNRRFVGRWKFSTRGKS